MYERTDARANKRMHKRTNARMRERTNARMRGRTNAQVRGRTNENTGLHPVLGYFAPSGLDGLMLMMVFSYD